METIEKKSGIGNKIFYTILILLIIGSVGVTFWRIVIEKDYQIEAETSCDPATESCFHYEGVTCDGTDSECVPEDAYDYKLISKKAASIYACEQTVDKVGCGEELSCTDEEENCSYTFCDPANLADGESCAKKTLTEPVTEEVEEVASSTVSE